MKQIKEKIKEVVNKKNQAISEKFEQLKQTPVLTTRTVVLKYKSCCGCGCSDLSIEREVAFDSPLQDGDRIKETLSTDKIL